MNFEWSDHYSIGIPEIDIQHKRILLLIESLFHEKKLDNEKIIIQYLYGYMTSHFISEELIMYEYGYPEIERQKDSHFFYLYQISNYVLPLKGENWNKKCFLNFLISWFSEHTMDEAKKWGEYINLKKQEGVKNGRGTYNQSVFDIQCG